MAVINFGSINIDHIYKVPHFVTPGETLSSSQYHSVLGGKGANQSIACAKAKCSTQHVGAVNINDISFLNELEEAGVNVEFVQQLDTTATGHAIIQVNDEAENAIVLFSGANHHITPAQVDTVLSNADKADWVLLQNETNAIADIINKAEEYGLPIAFNPAPMTPGIAQLPLEKVSILFVNEVEAMQLTQSNDIEQAAKTLREKYPNTKVIMTLGKAGVRYMHKGAQISVSGFAVNAIDTTAAGDTFTGFFLASYIGCLAKTDHNHIQQKDIEQALKTACAAAALCVTKSGAAPSIPSASDVATFLTSQR